MIDQYIDKNKLSYYKNSLECVCLLASSNEHQNGLLDHFINQICSHTSSQHKTIDFKIITTKNYQYQELKNQLKDIFRSIEVINIYIPDHIDFYYDNEQQCLKNIPIYGLKSGPNYIFLETLRSFKQYNTTLLLECDVYLCDDWLNKIIKYVDSSNGFWISGAMYDGNNNGNIFDIINTHINGGVGLYATGNQALLSFIDFCYDKIIEIIKIFGPNIPYDYLIRMAIEKYYNEDRRNRKIWQFIKRMYTYNNHIINYSPAHDKEKDIVEIQALYNYSILHKKPILI